MMEKIKSLELMSGEIAIFWLGQNSFILKTSQGTTLAVDPYLSRNEKLDYIHPEPPIKPEELQVDYVFCTHDHLDHTDPQTLTIVAKHHTKTLFLGPYESCERLMRLGVEKDCVKALRVGVPQKVSDIKVTAYYSVPPEEADTTHLGYIFEVEGVKIYDMGDTFQSVVSKPETILAPIISASPDIAILPIVGDTPERKPEDALLFAKLIKAKVVIPSHYGCFSNRTIDPQKFTELFKDAPDIKPVVIPYQGMYIYRA